MLRRQFGSLGTRLRVWDEGAICCRGNSGVWERGWGSGTRKLLYCCNVYSVAFSFFNKFGKITKWPRDFVGPPYVLPVRQSCQE